MTHQHATLYNMADQHATLYICDPSTHYFVYMLSINMLFCIYVTHNMLLCINMTHQHATLL